jgi:hypothetical protein
MIKVKEKKYEKYENSKTPKYETENSRYHGK